MVGRALDREVERYLEAVLARLGHQALELRHGAELGVDGVVAALLAADRPGRAGVAGLGLQRVVAALAVGHADRVDRRQVEHVEAQLGELRKPAADPLEAAERAGEQLVPGAEAGTHAFHLERQAAFEAGGVVTVGVALDGGHQLRAEGGVVLGLLGRARVCERD
jgi:hypothetical protein